MLAVAALVLALSGLPGPVRGDFDADGRPDVAELRPEPDGGARLVVRRGAGGDVEVERFEKAVVPTLYLSSDPAGTTLRTWCGKTGDKPCSRREVTVKGDGLIFGSEEASAFLALWTGRGFEVVTISD